GSCRLCWGDGVPDPLSLSRARPGHAAARPRRRDPRRLRQSRRLVHRQLRRRISLQFRPGDVPGTRLCRAVPANAGHPGIAPARSVRSGGGVRRLTLALALAALAMLPLWVGNSYYVNIASQILLYAIFALALNVLVGYARLLSLGHAGLFGIAAYAGALAINNGANHLVAIVAALSATLVAAAAFAVLALRGTGLGFVMITVAIGQIVWGVAYRWISITNGDN